jgi:hypothetical protein
MHGCRLLSLIVVLGLASSGCQFGNSFFQMDSNSKTPFMGFNLLGQNARSRSKEIDLREGPSQMAALPEATARGSSPVMPVAEIKPVSKPAVKNAVAKKDRKEPSLLEKLKLKTPEKVPLALTEPGEPVATGPKETFR